MEGLFGDYNPLDRKGGQKYVLLRYDANSTELYVLPMTKSVIPRNQV